MAVVDVLNTKKEAVSQVELSDEIFSVPVRGDILHQVVRMQMAGWRSGTASVKKFEAVQPSCSGKKEPVAPGGAISKLLCCAVAVLSLGRIPSRGRTRFQRKCVKQH